MEEIYEGLCRCIFHGRRARGRPHSQTIDNVFAGTRIERGRDGKRPPFSVDFIRQTILADGTLADLNDEARDVVLIAMETGCRPGEIVNLSKQRIVLDGVTPLHVANRGRLA